MNRLAVTESELPKRELRWDVLDEHLQEAAFAVAQMLRAFDSPSLNLDDLARHPEDRLLAHVDALVVAGEAARMRLLMPVLEAADPDEPGLATAAAWALIERGEFSALPAALAREELAIHRAVATAARWSTHPELDRWILESLDSNATRTVRAGLLEMSLARGLRCPSLLASLQSDDPVLVQAAARAAVHADPSIHLPVVERLLDHEVPEVREAALLASLCWGSQRAWSCCRLWAFDSGLAAILTAALGDRVDHARLVEGLADSGSRSSLLFALGFAGNTSLLGLLLEALGGPPLEAKLAAQSLGLTFGFLPADDAFALPPTARIARDVLPPAEEDPEALASLPPLEEDDLDADLVPPPEDGLPTPAIAAIRAFCVKKSELLPASKRVLFGAPFDAAQLATVLATCPLRWRHALALAHGVRGGGKCWLDTAATTARQRKQLATLSGPLRYLSF